MSLYITQLKWMRCSEIITKKIKVEIVYNSIRLNLVQKTNRYQKMGNKELNQSIYRSTATTLTTQP